MNWLREIVRYRDLLLILTWRDIRIRYKQSILGILWAVLMPIAIVMAGVVVRLAMATVSGKDLEYQDLSTVFVKSVPWAFFVSSIRFGTNCLIGNSNLVTRIYFPKLIFPLSAVLGQLFDFVVAACVLAVVLAFAGATLSIYLLWVPVLILLLVLFTAGLSIFLSAAGLFYRDVKYLVEIFVMFAIFITPVFFDASMFNEWETVLLLNPVAPLLEGLCDVAVFGRSPSLVWLLYSAMASTAVFAIGVSFFRHLEPQFAESI